MTGERCAPLEGTLVGSLVRTLVQTPVVGIVVVGTLVRTLMGTLVVRMVVVGTLVGTLVATLVRAPAWRIKFDSSPTGTILRILDSPMIYQG